MAINPNIRMKMNHTHTHWSKIIHGTPSSAWMLIALVVLLGTARPSQADLVGYWNLDEGTGTVAADSSGNGLNGTLGGPSGLPTWIPTFLTNGLDFTPASLTSGNLVTVQYNSLLQLNGAFSISFWYRPDYVPAASTFPGIMRIGAQGTTTGANIGWGFFRSQPNNIRFKRGNAQPDVWRPTLTVGQWHHIAITYDGAGNNVGFVNGVATNFTQTWLTATTTTAFEMGRMDAFDNAGLDDLALFNEGVSLAKMRSVYTVPSNLALGYNIASMRALWAIFDGGPGSSGIVDGTTWTYTTTFPGSTAEGDAYISGPSWFVVLGPGAGLTAGATLLGDISPAGIGIPGTQTYDSTPTIGTSARFIFDLGSTTTIGGGVNDLIEITGDLNVDGNTIAVNPLGPLANGTYRLINYTGLKSVSFNPTVVQDSRYTFTLDESSDGQVNLIVSGSNADLKWTSTSSGNWDLTSVNWENIGTSSPETFFQGDGVRFDESGAFQTNINLSLAVYPSSMTVESSALNYAFTGGGKLSGMEGGLTKNGTGQLTLGTANNFLGPVAINAGVVWAANGSAFGATNGDTTIASGATLDLRANNMGDERFIVSGAGVTNGGAILNSAGSPPNLWGPKWLSLAGDTTIGAFNGRWDICRVGGQLVGNGFTLTKVGPSAIDIGNAGETDLGDIFVQQGNLLLDGATTLGRPANLISLTDGTLLQAYATGGNILNKVMFITNATFQSAGGTANGFASPITLSGTGTLDTSANSPLTVDNVVSGDGNLRKIGPAALSLLGASIYTGQTTVEAGTLALVNNGSIGNSAGISLASGTSLVVTSRVDSTLTLSVGQSLGGSGSVVGSVIDASGATILPGGAIVAGTLPVSGDLSLNGGSTLDFNLAGSTTEGAGVNDLIAVGGDLNLTGLTTLRINPIAGLDTVNPYTLISYGGLISGDAANFTIVSDSRYSFVVDTTTTPGKVLITATGASSDLTWVGSVPGSETLWNVKDTANWNDGASASQFFFGDGVTFNDSATTFNVDVTEAVVPKSITFDNTTDYVLTGAGHLSGITGVTKNSAGRVTLNNSGNNNYTGPTVINAGTLEVGNGGVTGNLGPGAVTANGTLAINHSDAVTFGNTITGTGTLENRGAGLLNLPNNIAGFDGAIAATGGTIKPTVATGLGTALGGTAINGGTLDVNGLSLNLETVTVQGAGFNGLGAIVNGGAAQQNALRYVTLTGDTTIGGVNRWDVRGAPSVFNGNNQNLTKTGNNDVWIVDAGPTDLFSIFVNGGTLGIQGTTTLGSEFDNLTVNPGATLGLWGLNANVLNKIAIFNNGAINNGNGVNTFAGTVELNGSNAVTLAANTRLTFTEVLSGPGSLNVLGAGGTNSLVNANTYSGGTTIGGTSVLELGDGGTTGSILGDVLNNSSLSIYRSDEVPLVNNVTGLGNIAVRTGSGLVVDGTAGINIGGSIEVGRFVPGKMILKDGASVTAGRILLGNPASVTGDVVQEGGDVVVSIEARIGHWPTENSTYLLGGGTFSLTNVPAGVVNPNAVAEQPGILYIGIDGTGSFTQTGGIASVHGIVLDGRGPTTGPGVDTFALDGGRFIIGPSGIKSGNLDLNANYIINLGGGTIASSGNWTSVLNMTITGTGGSVTFDSGEYTNLLTGALTSTGPGGGLVKTGAGTLVLGGAETFEGNTIVNQGTLAVTGLLGAGGFDEVRIVNGTLAGTGTLTNNTIIEAGGILAPGLSIGTLTFSYSLELSGTTIMEINKSGTTLTSDRVQGGIPLAFGGTLNIVASGDPLAPGDAFDLFDAISPQGTFAAVNPPDLPAGLSWDTSMLYVDGTITVIGSSEPTINFLLSGSRFELSWDPLAVGYALQGQTNPIGQGIVTSNWVDVLTGVINNTYVVDPVPTNQNVFYQLIKP